ncbi:Putative N-acetylmannosamine-6-phosphate epimerase superfamily protein [Nostoc sp. NIES-3756]|uniref:GNAT family N-acetyltransferase n=1 Tax=Nostoc sp. NIES-3756 TaxID=1751286 RepID=UPI00071FB31E|nr:GNAT family N-acetyltransferase [Nostoc sp. NIES-3756]BAT55347.1 Putative N-acetylmannosamine-6-phosphate epimerase superfamily protein [Nostoc sp. NIES-3756]
MTDFIFSIEDNPDSKDVQAVISKIIEFNNNSLQYKDIASSISVLIRNTEVEIVGGLVGKIHWGWLFVSYLWVDERLRGQGYGTQLLLKAEQAANERGCSYAYLDTFSFQALGFYQRLGYEIFGVLENFPPGHQRYFLQKNLQTQSYS